MSTRIFVNLPVKDLNASMTFFQKLGYQFNPQFTDETAACMVVSEENFVMLVTHDKFRMFTPNPVADARQATEVIVALSCETKSDVARIVELALGNGGARYAEPKDYGFMVQDGFQDLDGHIWEYFWMDPAAIQKS